MIRAIFRFALFFLFLGCIQNGLAQNVGVNTTGAAPAANNLFEVLQPSTTANSVATYSRHLGNPGSGTAYAFQAIANGAGVNNVAAYLSATGASGTNYSLIVPSGGGNVGIGTTAPNARLSILESTNNILGLNITDGTSALFVVPTLSAGGWNPLAQAGDMGIIFHDGAVGTGNLVLAPWNASALGMRIQSDGNVGIGVSSPLEKLDINGDLRVRGSGGTIGGTNIANGYLLIGAAGSGVGIDNNEMYFDGLDANFGVLSAHNLNIRTGGALAMFISGTNQNIGIGNAAPGYKLDVTGTAHVDGLNVNGAYSLPTADGTANYVLKTNGSGTVAWTDPNTLVSADITAVNAGTGLTGGGASGSVTLGIHTETDDDITNRAPSSTGLGSGFYQTATATTAEGWPETSNNWYHLINVQHTNTSNNYAMQFAGSYFNQNVFYRSTNNNGSQAWSTLWHSTNDGASSGLDADLLDGISSAGFIQNQTASDQAAGFRINGNGLFNGGNVGIGTTGPGAKLEIYSAGLGLYFNQGTAADQYIRYHIPGVRWWTVGPKANGDFWFTNASDHGSSVAVSILNGGNVGIGTSSPAQKLDVNGYIALEGKEAARGNDSWLRLNQANAFTSGTYTPYLMRADGGLQVDGTQVIGANGADVYADVRVIRNTHLSDGMYIGYGNAGTTGGHLRFYANNMTERMIIRADNGRVGIGTSAPGAQLTVGAAFTGTVYSTTFTTNSGALGTTAGNSLNLANIGFTSSNQSSLGIKALRTSNGSDWTTVAVGLTMDVDNTSPVNSANIWLRANGNVGMGTSAPTQKLEVSGRVKSNGINETSDLRLKKDIVTIANALQKVNSIRGVNYYWKKDEYPDKGLDDTKQMGVIAQEVEGVVPEVVITDSEGYKSVEYSKMVGLLIEAVKDLSVISEQQKDIIEKLSLENNVLKSENLKTKQEINKINQYLGISSELKK